MTYQTIDDQPGDSHSPGKLVAIQMPDSLDGKSVLDLGCNEGFFCKAALARGARRAVGFDANLATVEKAKRRFPEAEFMARSWWDLPTDEKFDLVLMLSALHYEPKPRELCDAILKVLKPGGLFILECGVFTDDPGMRWLTVDRHDGPKRYPTVRLLTERILEGYAVRYIGPSVPQRGDIVARHVFHLRPYEPIVNLIVGPSGVGKTSLTKEISKGGIVSFSADVLLMELASLPNLPNSSLRTFLRGGIDHLRLDLVYERIVTDGLEHEFAEALTSFIARECRLTVIEGYAFLLPPIRDAVLSRLRMAGFRVWISHPG